MFAHSEFTGPRAGNSAIGESAARPRARRVNDACKALSISRSHLYNMAAKGEIRLIHIGNRTLVPETEIDRLLGEVSSR
jgi:excisionase family DNA binding protein